MPGVYFVAGLITMFLKPNFGSYPNTDIKIEGKIGGTEGKLFRYFEPSDVAASRNESIKSYLSSSLVGK